MVGHFIHIPRLRTVLSLVCVLLVCTFYWDWIVLHSLYNTRKATHTQVPRTNISVEWSWQCVEGYALTKTCRRVQSDHHSRGTSLATCTMTCSPGTFIWPYPTGDVKVKNSTAAFHPRQLKVDFSPVDNVEVSTLLKKMTKLYQERISRLAQNSHAPTSVSKLKVTVQVKKSTKDRAFKVNIDESYKLIIGQKKLQIEAVIKANTFLGAHHGLESLTQLIWWDERHQVLKILNNVVITDAPVFTYRGLLLDTSSRFIPLPSICRTLDAMSMSKLNVFHWHITDSKSFPYASKRFPGFKKFGPYSSEEVYSPEDIKHVVEYAETRGVTVLIEIDAPAHTSQGWEWGEFEGIGNMSLCLDAQPFSEFCAEPPCGLLNPVNENSYFVLTQVLKELSSITNRNTLMHIGGGDVDFRCWESFGDITEMDVYVKKGVAGVWDTFYEKLLGMLAGEKILPPNLVMWSNELLDESSFWKQLKHSSPIIQSRGPTTSGELERLVKDKFRVIVSSSDMWYLSEAQNWLFVYLYRPWMELSAGERKLVLGGEACAWTEHLDHVTMDPRLWPVTAAVAERLWADPAQILDAQDRLVWFRERMVQLGIPSSPVVPKWCLHNPYQCS